MYFRYYLENLNYIIKLILKMDPNLNRNSMGSRAGTALRNNLGGPGGAQTRLGTAGRVLIL